MSDREILQVVHDALATGEEPWADVVELALERAGVAVAPRYRADELDTQLVVRLADGREVRESAGDLVLLMPTYRLTMSSADHADDTQELATGTYPEVRRAAARHLGIPEEEEYRLDQWGCAVPERARVWYLGDAWLKIALVWTRELARCAVPERARVW